MADRKVLNKYYPPDFDPTKLPRLRLNPVKTFTVRIMAPFNMRCNTCGEYIYKGKKFNSKKEDVLDMDYLGLKIFRFFIKCTRCLAEISFRTDPENTDYVCEQGATRNFQAHDFAEREEKLQALQDEEDEANPMKALEKRTRESKNEMDVIDALEELKDLNARHANASIDSMLETVAQKKTPQELADEEDARVAKETFDKKRKAVKRLQDDETTAESDDVNVISNFSLPKSQTEDLLKMSSKVVPNKSKSKFSSLVVKKKKPRLLVTTELPVVNTKPEHAETSGRPTEHIKTSTESTEDNKTALESNEPPKSSLLLLTGYSSSDSD